MIYTICVDFSGMWIRQFDSQKSENYTQHLQKKKNNSYDKTLFLYFLCTKFLQHVPTSSLCFKSDMK